MDITLDRVTYVHAAGRRPAVAGATLRIVRGEAVGLIGPNGAGKSTLLGCLLGFLRPARGAVSVDGLPPDGLAVRARVGALSEKPAFPAGMTAMQVLAFHHALLRRPGATRAEEARALLARVGLEAAASRSPSQFSHGMRQRLGLAAALLGDPALLVLDEPATGLDPPGTALLRAEIQRARDRGATVILSSHQLDEVERSCDRIVYMNEGVIRSDAPLQGMSGAARTWRIRVMTPDGGVPARGPVESALREAGAGACEIDGGVLRLTLAGDEVAGRLVAALVRADMLVVEAVPDRPRLEALFEGETPR